MTQKSPLAWLGGKSRLADQIIERMPPHETYCEVFAGAAWVLFKKPESKVEIINDINSELTNLYRCVKHHLAEVVLQFRWMLVARDDFDRFLRTPADSLTDIQRAARFFYLAKSSFGAKIHKPTFGIAATGAPRLNLLRIEEELSDAHARLAAILGACKGKFILSLNDTAGVRETFRGFRIEAVRTRYSIAATAKQEVGEVLITNFKSSKAG